MCHDHANSDAPRQFFCFDGAHVEHPYYLKSSFFFCNPVFYGYFFAGNGRQTKEVNFFNEIISSSFVGHAEQAKKRKEKKKHNVVRFKRNFSLPFTCNL